jgi:acetyl esterase
MALHPQAAAFLEQIAKQKTPSLDSLPIDITRRALILGSTPGPNPPSLAKIENRMAKRSDGTELPLRIYVPHGIGPFGVSLYFHGGGWVLNNIDTHDDLVRRLAAASGCVFVNVDYRLAPEHKYPAATEDAYTALNWVHDHATEIGVDANRIAVSGDSAGGNLAAVVCLMSRDRGGPQIAYQALIYPITDCDFQRPSYLANGEGYFLTHREMDWFWKHYVSSTEQMREPYASPLLAPSLRDLPPALVLTVEYDPLRDEGDAYACALQAAGVEVKHVRYDGLIHAFMKRVQQFDAATTAIQQVADELRNAIGN